MIKEYFTFSKKERNAAIILSVVLVLFILLPYAYKAKSKNTVIDTELQQQTEKFQSTNIPANSTNTENEQLHLIEVSENLPANTNVKLFAFNPNTIDAAGWKRLGLRDKTINTIINYRNKGGKFRKPEDLKKIWGMRPQEAERLIPFINITTAEPQTSFKKTANNNSTSVQNTITIIDINTATPEQMKSLPGMDYRMPYRILGYRDKLGGFYSVDQIKETYGITDSMFQSIKPYIKIDNKNIIQLNINTASDYELSNHPYIGKDIGKAIFIYRQQHGNYQTVSDLKKIIFLREEAFQKMLPYVTVL
jgi:DNA uptake protein ComE-like DNA-binding protein